ncbi:MAG: type IV toxin-antitoxin system AbiEi family antitoxin domain-containing protein [Propionibacteriaceae bacterium]
MKTSEARRALAELTESQWGLVTSRQALARGVSHMQLTRFTEADDLTRLTHGVYRDSGAPAHRLDDLRAAWLSTDPAKLAYERLSDGATGVIVSLTTAANLHGIGDFPQTIITFTTPDRRQTQKQDIRFRTCELSSKDVTVVEGLPTTTRERTIADLIETREDLTTVANAYRDSCRQSRIDRDHMEDLLAPLAQRNGFAKNDGTTFLHDLDKLAGLDIDSIAKEIASSPKVVSKICDHYVRMIMQYTEIQLPDIGKLFEAANIFPNIQFPQNQSIQQILKQNEMLQASLNPILEMSNLSQRILPQTMKQLGVFTAAQIDLPPVIQQIQETLRAVHPPEIFPKLED